MSEPLWKGPHREGITFTLLNKYLSCKERFRLQVIDGWRSREQFDKALEFGNMWHICEEALAGGKSWEKPIENYCKHHLFPRFPHEWDSIQRWKRLCLMQFPIYVRWWEKHRDVVDRIPIMQERVFDVTYILPSGRTVILMGKMDSVDYIKGKGVVLKENKTKGSPNPELIRKQLKFDLQTGKYLVALDTCMTVDNNWVLLEPNRDETIKVDLPKAKRKSEVPRLAGINYNVVKRPLSSGKHSIKCTQGKPDFGDENKFLERLAGLIENESTESDGTHMFFMRWTVDITPEDLLKFREQCLDPILENVYDDYEWWEWCHVNDENPYDYKRRDYKFHYHQNRHFRLPYGLYNELLERGCSDFDDLLDKGSDMGLEKCVDLFPELRPLPV